MGCYEWQQLTQLYEKYTRTRSNVKAGTEIARNRLMALLKEDKLGNSQIGSVKPSDAEEWALRMKEKGMGYVNSAPAYRYALPSYFLIHLYQSFRLKKSMCNAKMKLKRGRDYGRYLRFRFPYRA